MMPRYIKHITFALILCLWSVPLLAGKYDQSMSSLSEATTYKDDVIPADQLRPVGVHNAGNIYLAIGSGVFPTSGMGFGSSYDPETGERLESVSFPQSSSTQYLFLGGLSIGGIVNGDTLVSSRPVFTSYASSELFPKWPDSGGVIRTASLADDEFRVVYFDTVTNASLIGYSGAYDTAHTPLGLKVTQVSYSWRDSLYDDFVIIEYQIENIGNNFITGGFAGLYFDCDIYSTNGDLAFGSDDDASAFLDTLLDDNDPNSRVKIAYSYDIDGDPSIDTAWTPNSSRGVFSVSLLDSDLDDPTINFNWWNNSFVLSTDFGPRRLGSEQDPFYTFIDSALGTPRRNIDAYYMMAHPEVDYNSIEIDIHDSTDGWVESARGYDNFNHDTRFQYSIGPFDLQPGDSFRFAVAIAGTDNFHVAADDYIKYFQPDTPSVFQERLDLSGMIDAHRRADLVYQSGLTLPLPGAPVGLRILEYDDTYVIASWNKSSHPRVAGYYLNIKDTVYDDLWRHAFPKILTDTICTLMVINPSHEYFLAVSLEDDEGRESDVSFPITVVPGRPHMPQNLCIEYSGGRARLDWQPYSDTSLLVYYIYRGTWDGSLELYDSTASLIYYDYLSSSGVSYSYSVTARNLLDLESEPTPVVSVIPMIMDRGILFYDINYDFTASTGPYKRHYSTRLRSMIEPYYPLEFRDIDDSLVAFKQMADYSLIIFDLQKENGFLPSHSIDSIRYYLQSGGAGLFLLSNVALASPSPGNPATSYYEPGDFFYDIFHLDSSVSNGLAFFGGMAHGDLIGALPEQAGYPEMVTDSSKMDMSGPLQLYGYIPRVGCLYPQEDVEILYRYNALNPDSGLHNQVTGIKYLSDDLNIVVLNFPLALMTEPANIDLLKKVVTELGADMSCGDIDSNGRTNVGDVVYLVKFLFGDGPAPPAMYRADVNCDGVAGLGDAIMLINVIFKNGAGLTCCPQP